ncbi:uncharacterized protein LOC123317687 [Coccinella septempunctata]|uniref:uncharacterized protein LOC123317687 n=1 Tax=Coccinella septempunctata TaxID=41139 RepID=UPI001D07AEFC|nr:uncharacterized protein LOC123317687 [Coccinella septempunctata]
MEMEMQMQMKKEKMKLKLIEMESAVKEAEIIEMEDTGSELTSAATKSTNRERHSSKYPPVSTTIHNQELDKNQIVSDWVNAINPSQIDDYPNPVIQNKVESDVDKLCKALSEVLRTVNPAPTKVKPDAFFARQSIERECPIFDGKSEDWPIFISHFRKISTMCDYTKEESMMNLQKCLRGEAKQAVAGQDNIRLTLPRRIIQGPEHLPIATKTHLGWILHGNTSGRTEEKYIFHICDNNLSDEKFHVCDNPYSDEMLHKLVKESFTLDAFGVSASAQTKRDKENDRAVDVMKRTINRIGQRFEIGLLWKEDDMKLPESKSVAYRRLLCVEKQMLKDDIFKKKYCDNIQKYIDKGYARKLTGEEAKKEGARTWYLPHFGVINPHKPQKLRLVFDAAAKSHGISLNSNLLAGPDYLQSLVAVLIRFRERKVAFSSDIREMFHQVRITEIDQDSQRFLWRNVGTSERVIEAITRRHYVDDYLDCVDSPLEAYNLITEVSRTQSEAGFELVNWTTNSKELMKMMSFDENLNKDLNLDMEMSLQRVLGLSWSSAEDKLVFKLNFHPEQNRERPTKRHVLRIIMSVFDPLGFLVNFIIRGRILVQDIWRSGIGWDDFIDDDIYKTWLLWLADLQKVISLKIPRCYSLKIPVAESIELHVFCDSSKKAFAAVAYLRIIHACGIDISFVFAKARVSPTKPISIPRLELQAAVMGTRIAKTLKNELDIKINQTYFWTDSSTVLYWICSDGRQLGQFESHRVGEIQESSETKEWNWIPTKLNIADLATRTYNEDGSNSINFENWFLGPTFLLQKDKTKWPTKNFSRNPSSGNKEEFENCVLTIFQDQSALPDIKRFSKWIKLIRTTARVLKFIKILRNSISLDSRIEKALKLDDIQEAEVFWIRQCQKESFYGEIMEIQRRQKTEGQSRLRKLMPMIDSRGILVIQGRTNLAPFMKESAKHPIILPNKHPFTRLLIQHYHEKYGHQGIELVLNELRQNYWIIDGRSAVKSVFASCQFCRIRRAKPQVPVMGQLPVERLTPRVKPFTFTGIDYFGPLTVTVGRRHEKRWGVLFTCLTIRAVHLEVTHSLSTDSTIMALRRFIARRGRPKTIFSDNGTNLHGAMDELKRAIRNIDQNKVENDMQLKEIEWKNIPPAAPHMGGVWERLIRSVKKTFHVILATQRLKDELLLTLFAEIENMINTRPITKVSNDPDDWEALTPNHFLLGTSNGDCFGEMGNIELKREWRKVQRITNEYWKRWMKEYLPRLTKRNVWCNDSKPITKGDIVIIIEDNVLRNSWKLGRVEEVFPGPDVRIRVANVKTKNGILKRPVTKLARVIEQT